MARRCDLTGKGSQNGHKVSHSNRKTKRLFRLNLQHVSLKSDALGNEIPLRIPVSTLRSIDHNGGLDGYLLAVSARKLTPEARTLKRKIQRALEKKQPEQTSKKA